MSYLGRNLFGQRIYTNGTVMSMFCFKNNHQRCKRKAPLYLDVYCQCECHASPQPDAKQQEEK